MSKIDFLHQLRKFELNNSFEKSLLSTETTAQMDMLEIGSGSGYQLQLLKERFKSAKGIDVAETNYKEYQTTDVITYDGTNIPFPDQSFDMIFSSNTLEHIPHLTAINREFYRVLKDNGYSVHILPTHTWRLWTSLFHYIAVPVILFRVLRNKFGKREAGSSAKTEDLSHFQTKSLLEKIVDGLVSTRHGERGNRFNEYFYFKPSWWIKNFEQNNWKVVQDFPTGLFYTGYTILGNKLSFSQRQKLAKILGSSCHTFVLQKGKK